MSVNPKNNRKNWLLIFLIFFSTMVFSENATLLLRKDQQLHKSVTAAELMQLKTAITSLTIHNAIEDKTRVYQGVLLTALLDQSFGTQWTQAQAVSFIANDGYQASIPTVYILAHQGMIAVGEQNRPGFATMRQKETGKTIVPGSFYLLWENINDSVAKKDDGVYQIYQLASLELTGAQEEYPQAMPPNSDNPLVNKGFLVFKQHCIMCHSLNGDGGKLGPELNYPVNVTEYWQPEWLLKFITDPQSVRANSKMLALPAEMADRGEQIEAIIAYLKAMSLQKTPPVAKK